MPGYERLDLLLARPRHRPLFVDRQTGRTAQDRAVGLDRLAPEGGSGEDAQIEAELLVALRRREELVEPPGGAQSQVRERGVEPARGVGVFVVGENPAEVERGVPVGATDLELEIEVELAGGVGLGVGQAQVEGAVELLPEAAVELVDADDVGVREDLGRGVADHRQGRVAARLEAADVAGRVGGLHLEHRASR